MRREPVPWWRAEAPFALLLGAALVSPWLVLDQGGDLRTAILAGVLVLGVPGAAIESMLGAVRCALLLRDRAP
jgi:hypothetical protein